MKGKSKIPSHEFCLFDSGAVGVIVSFEPKILENYNAFCSASESNKQINTLYQHVYFEFARLVI